MPQRRYLIAWVLISLLLGAAVSYLRWHVQDVALHPGNAASTPLVDSATLATLPTKSASSADLSHLGPDILPPTNSWLSGMVLQKTPLAVYPMPLSFLAKASGFEVGLPTVSSTATSITGEHTAGVQAAISQASDFKLSRYDKVSATLTYTDANAAPIAAVTLAEGSPYVYFQAKASSTITLTGINPTAVHDHNAQYARYGLNGHDYIVAAYQSASLSQHGSTLVIQAGKGSLVTFYALSNPSTKDTLRAYAGNALQSVAVTHAQAGKTITTTLHYQTSGSEPTVFTAMPYQQVTSKLSTLTTYDSIYGQMKALKGTTLTTSVPTATPDGSLDLSRLTKDQKAQLSSTLKTDAANTVIDQTDSYFAGKQLARAANLLDIAEQLGQTEAITQLKTTLNDAFSKRLDASYFYYDTGLKGIAASTKAFGSEDFNDHHFHYGYFLYAAAILGKYDTSFVNNYKNQVNLLAADIATYQKNKNFPPERTYDPYAGHSWAAGLAPFSDGNNQESSSEAINAWNGVSLWGSLTKNASLQQTGQWILANEAATAQSAWRSVNTKATGMSNYTSPLVDINFGGKRVYSTFFSDAPGAKLGIQLIPFNPMMTSFVGDGTTVTTQVNAAIQHDNFNVALGDYDLMYLALVNPQKAQTLSAKQQDAFIDNGNSRTYLDAWILTQLDK